MSRLAVYWRIASLVLASSLLIFLWLGVLYQFFSVMLPRFAELHAQMPLPADRPCDSPQCDFSAFWPAGVLAAAHHPDTVYNQTAFWDFRRQMLGPQVAAVRWFYAPVSLLPVAAIAHLPFEAAFWVWDALLSLGALAVLRWARLPWSVVVTALLSPAALWNAELGQFGAIMGGCLVAGLLAVETMPRGAGISLGLLLVKPQYGVLLPVALLAGRRWRVMLICALICILLLVLTVLLFGVESWRAYIADGLPLARQLLEMPPQADGSQKFGVSVFWMLRSFGVGVGGAYQAQLAASLLAIGGTVFVWRGKAYSPLDRMALTVFLSLLATPYGYTDDMVAWSVALAALAQRQGWRIGFLDALFWLWPMLCPIVTIRTGYLLTPAVIALALLRTAMRAYGDGTAVKLGQPGAGLSNAATSSYQ